MEKIIIIEDDVSLGRFLELELNHEGYNSSIEKDGRAGLERLEKEEFDLLILDVMLPSLNGMEILRRLRQAEKDIPVIMLTARDQVMDKVMGLDLGADDYMTKPFAIEELLARIRRILRNKKVLNEEVTNQDVMCCKDLMLDIKGREVNYKGNIISLTKTEFDLLEYLIMNEGRALSREQIVSKVWGYDFEGDTNIVDVYVRYLRSKIDDVFGVKIISTVRGVGYQIKR